MLKVGDKLICKTEGQPETEFCIRGEVKKVEGDIVTISRALKFGTLPMHKERAAEILHAIGQSSDR